jgi:hypothetical protein
MDEVPQDVAQRRYERWVMRAAELVHGDYPEVREEAERVLLMRLRDGYVGGVPPTDLWEDRRRDFLRVPKWSALLCELSPGEHHQVDDRHSGRQGGQQRHS